ncbi:MAG: carbohydrate-binding protein, partial [Oscillospiraceae bacterium]|nr:carbohydrate-binding protein [Oscillospiraceae bacterium]
ANHYMETIQIGVGDTVEFSAYLNGAKREIGSAITVDPAALATVSTGTNVFAFTGKTKGTGTVVFQDSSSSYEKTLHVVGAEEIPEVIIEDIPPEKDPNTDPPENQTKIRSAFEQIPAREYDEAQNLTNMEKVDGECYCLYKNIDFDTGALSVSMAAYFTNNTGAMVEGAKGYYELRLDGLAGTLIGTVNVPQTLRDANGQVSYSVYSADITTTTGIHDLYVVFKTAGKNVVLGDKWLIFSREAVKNDQPQVIRDAFVKIEAESADDKGNLEIAEQAENLTVLGFIKNGAFALYKNVDFGDGAKYFYMQANSHAVNASGGTVSLHLDAPDGKVIGSITLEPDAPDWMTYSQYFTEIELTKGLHDLYLTFSNETTMYVMNIDHFVFTKEKTDVVNPPEGVKKGDVNADGSIDLKDVTILRRYLAGGWNVTINEANADVNSDGSIDLKDFTILRRYLAGGWNITL